MNFSELYDLKEDTTKEDNKRVQTYTIPEGTKKLAMGDIPKDAEVLILPTSLEVIEHTAFQNYPNLTDVKFMGDCNKGLIIGSSAFQGCKKLKNVILPNNVNVKKNKGSISFIGHRAFMNCESLENITIPAGLKAIQSFAFRGCTSLQNVTIPAGVKELAPKIFFGCVNLKKVVIEGSIRTMYPCALSAADGDPYYSISFRTDKKYHIDAFAHTTEIETYPKYKFNNLIVYDRDLCRLKTDSILLEAEDKELIKKSFDSGSLTGKGIFLSGITRFDYLLEDFNFVKDNLYNMLESISPSDFKKLKVHINLKNIKNFISIFNRINVLHKNSEVASYISDLLKIQGEANSKEDVPVVSGLVENMLRTCIEWSLTKDEAFTSAKNALLEEGIKLSDEEIQKFVDAFFIDRSSGKKETKEGSNIDAREAFDNETDNLANKKNEAREIKLFNRIFEKSRR